MSRLMDRLNKISAARQKQLEQRAAATASQTATPTYPRMTLAQKPPEGSRESAARGRRLFPVYLASGVLLFTAVFGAVLWGFPVYRASARLLLHEAPGEERWEEEGVLVRRLADSKIFEVVATARAPSEAADRANAFSQALLERLRQRAVDQVEFRITALGPVLEEAQARLASQIELRNHFLESNGWTDFNAQRRRAQQRVAELKAVLRDIELAKRSRQQALTVALFLKDDFLRDLTRRLNLALAEHASVRSRFKEQSPYVLQSKRLTDRLGRMLEEALEERRASLQVLLDSEAQRWARFNQEEAQIHRLQAQVAQAKRQYQSVLSQQGNARLERAMLEQPAALSQRWVVLQPAVAPPQIPGWIRVGVALALSLSAVSLLWALFKRSIGRSRLAAT